MEPKGKKSYAWLFTSDLQIIKTNTLLCKMDPPIPVSCKLFQFSKETMKKVNSLFLQGYQPVIMCITMWIGIQCSSEPNQFRLEFQCTYLFKLEFPCKLGFFHFTLDVQSKLFRLEFQCGLECNGHYYLWIEIYSNLHRFALECQCKLKVI